MDKEVVVLEVEESAEPREITGTLRLLGKCVFLQVGLLSRWFSAMARELFASTRATKAIVKE